MPTFPKEVREDMFIAAHGFCQCSKECVKPITEFDHILPNTKPNQKKYPLFLQSPFNCCPINQHCHKEKGSKKISYALAKVYEKYLSKNPIKVKRI